MVECHAALELMLAASFNTPHLEKMLLGRAIRSFWVFSTAPPRRKSMARGRGVAQPGSAPVLGTGGREFESRRPDHHLNRTWFGGA